MRKQQKNNKAAWPLEKENTSNTMGTCVWWMKVWR